MIDTHCHLDDLVTLQGLPGVVARMRQAGVSVVVTVGVSPDRWAAQKMVAEQVRALGCTVGLAYGIHPWWADRVEPAAGLAALSDWLEQERGNTLAVGEIGLDSATDMPDASRQYALVEGQMDLALQHNLPVILHERKSADQLLKMIRHRPGLRGVVHGFTGSLQQAQQLIERGFYLGVGAAITHPRATRLRATLAASPPEALLLESDAPNQSGHAHWGEPNEPAYIIEQLAVLAELLFTDAPTLANRLDANARALFGRAALTPTDQ
ncbi:MAG TPA: TatD family hydrolase [Halothiobacillus sp.]|nr:TatD family hydrolase [Halothiobacillus sp.]